MTGARNSKKTGDVFRHEWISCRLIADLVAASGNTADDREWLRGLSERPTAKKPAPKTLDVSDKDTLGGLPPIASAVCWLIVSHHRLPGLHKEDAKIYIDTSVEASSEMLAEIKGCWGYAKESVVASVKFKSGTLEDSPVWCKQIRKWAQRTLAAYDNIVKLLGSGAFRLSMGYMRLSLMAADYFFSSQPAQTDWQGSKKLYANTEKGILKQHLDEHLVGVAAQATEILHRLPQMASRMESARDVRPLKKKSPARFAWQDRVAEKITEARKENKTADCGWFVVNMASTGCGKTIANAKIMRAISPGGDELRYVLALGLRSLTLQTGDEYREKLGLTGDDLAVLVGDTAVRDLHMADAQKKYWEDDGETAYRESLLDGDLNYLSDPKDEFLNVLFRQSSETKKNKAFLYKPVIVATIDHIVAATETVRGGKYMLPFLRLMTSDLVIDEVDDFGPDDLWAVARLVHLAGMLGRNVAISSATIPPDLAEALFHAYQKGRAAYGSFFDCRERIACVWCDEFKASVAALDTGEEAATRREFHELHRSFVEKRVGKIREQVVRRRAVLADCRPSEEKYASDNKSRQNACFEKMQEAAIALHDAHHVIDRLSGKRVSFGVIRMANIDPCVAVSKFLLASEWKQGYDVRLMTYHSRQTRLLRHEQERYLDNILKRKEGWQDNILEKEPVLRHHIDAAAADDLLFIVAATPVEEIGRDHDFDWAVIEPSSYRSVIQMAGRVLRHRPQEEDITAPNIAVMRYNLRGLQDAPKAFCRPGYETGGKYTLTSHDMKELTDEEDLRAAIDSIPRIRKPDALLPHERLLDLEHQVMQDFNDMERKGLAGLRGYLDECWWLTGLPQTYRRFRDGRPEVELFYCYGDDGEELGFYERDKEGNYNHVEKVYNIENEAAMTKEITARLWLQRDYGEALLRRAGMQQGSAPADMSTVRRLAKKYGKISVPAAYIESGRKLVYADDFGVSRAGIS